MSHRLLPSGFLDRRSPSAEKIFNAEHQLAQFFIGKGYEFRTPPLMEFAGASRDVFRVTDPDSRETLVLRGDVTKQIARAVEADVAKGDADFPLRICYSGKALRTQAEELGGLRERTQAGLELIGAPAQEAVTEVASLLLENLLNFRRRKVVFVVGLPALVQALEGMTAFTDNEKAEYRRALAYKDKDYAKKKLNDVIDVEWLLGMKHAAPDMLPENLTHYCSAAQALCSSLPARFSDVECRMEPADVHRYPYHKNIVFTVLCAETGRDLARGGHYMLADADAAGATLYVEDVCS